MSAGGDITSWQQLSMAYSSWLGPFVLLLSPEMERHPKDTETVSTGPVVLLLSCNDPPVWAGSVLSAAIVLSSCLFPNGFVDLTLYIDTVHPAVTTPVQHAGLAALLQSSAESHGLGPGL